MSGSNIHLSINSFDAFIFGVFFLSTIIAFFRGFIRELLSFGAWIGAALITIYFFPQAEHLMHQYVKSDKVAAGAGALIIYFIALIVISIINGIILKYVKDADVGLLDNFLGMLFGGLRGAFIVSFAFLVLAVVVPQQPPQEPDWLKNSITKPYLKIGADMLKDAAPKYMVDMEAFVKKQADHENNPQNYPPAGQTISDKP